MILSDGHGTIVSLKAGENEAGAADVTVENVANQKYVSIMTERIVKGKINVDEKKNGENLPELKESNLENVAQEIAGGQLTSEEKTALNNGATLTISLEMTNIDDTVPTKDKNEVLQAAAEKDSGIKVGLYLDLSLLKRIQNNQTGTVTKANITKTTTPVTFKLTMPDSLKAPSGVSRTFYLFRCHDGNAEVIAQSSGMEMKVSSDLFSTYAIGYKDTAVTGGSSSGKSSSGTSSTSSTASSSSSSGSSSVKTYKDNKNAAKAYFTKTGKKTVSYYEPALGKSAKNAVVKATVTLGKKVFKITSVSPYAFTGYDKLQTVTIGKNVRKLSEYSFFGCDSLKTLVIRTDRLTAKNTKGALKDSGIKEIVLEKKAIRKYKLYKKLFKGYKVTKAE